MKRDQVGSIKSHDASLRSGKKETQQSLAVKPNKSCDPQQGGQSNDAYINKPAHQPDIVLDDYFQDEDEHRMTKAEDIVFVNDSKIMPTLESTTSSKYNMVNTNSECETNATNNPEIKIKKLSTDPKRDDTIETQVVPYLELPTTQHKPDSIYYAFHNSITNKPKQFPTLYHVTDEPSTKSHKLLDKLKLNITLPSFLKKESATSSLNPFEITLGLPKSRFNQSVHSLTTKRSHFTTCYHEDRIVCVNVPVNKHNKENYTTNPTTKSAHRFHLHQNNEEETNQTHVTIHGDKFNQKLKDNECGLNETSTTHDGWFHLHTHQHTSGISSTHSGRFHQTGDGDLDNDKSTTYGGKLHLHPKDGESDHVNETSTAHGDWFHPHHHDDETDHKDRTFTTHRNRFHLPRPKEGESDNTDFTKQPAHFSDAYNTLPLCRTTTEKYSKTSEATFTSNGEGESEHIFKTSTTHGNKFNLHQHKEEDHNDFTKQSTHFNDNQNVYTTLPVCPSTTEEYAHLIVTETTSTSKKEGESFNNYTTTQPSDFGHPKDVYDKLPICPSTTEELEKTTESPKTEGEKKSEPNHIGVTIIVPNKNTKGVTYVNGVTESYLTTKNEGKLDKNQTTKHPANVGNKHPDTYNSLPLCTSTKEEYLKTTKVLSTLKHENEYGHNAVTQIIYTKKENESDHNYVTKIRSTVRVENVSGVTLQPVRSSQGIYNNLSLCTSTIEERSASSTPKNTSTVSTIVTAGAVSTVGSSSVDDLNAVFGLVSDLKPDFNFSRESIGNVSDIEALMKFSLKHI